MPPPRRPVLSVALTLTLCVCLAAAEPFVAARGFEAWAWLDARDDPASLTTLGLKTTLTPERLRTELAAALDAEDIDLATSFVTLAGQQGLAIPPDLQARYDAANRPLAAGWRATRQFTQGVWSGEAAGNAGFAGALAGDAVGVGDVRDLVGESRKIAGGQAPDRFTLGLAVAGLAITGATVATFGAAAPARAGVSAIKAAARSGRLSKPLLGEVERLATGAVDTPAARSVVARATALDLRGAAAAAREAVNPAAFARLRGLAGDVSTIGRRAGAMGARDALTIARDSGEVRAVAKLAEARGGATRAVLKTLGRGAIALGAGVVALAGWTMAGVGYVWLAILVALALVKRVARLVFWGGGHAARFAFGAPRSERVRA